MCTNPQINVGINGQIRAQDIYKEYAHNNNKCAIIPVILKVV